MKTLSDALLLVIVRKTTLSRFNRIENLLRPRDRKWESDVIKLSSTDGARGLA